MNHHNGQQQRKRITVNDVKRWAKTLKYKTVLDDGSHYVDVMSPAGELILGGDNPMPPFGQWYPTYDEILQALGADTITDKAFALASETIRQEIDGRLFAVLVEQTAEVITRLARTGFLAIQEIDAALEAGVAYSPVYNPEQLARILNRLNVTHRIELKTTKRQLAENIGIKLYEVNGINYGFVQKKVNT